MLFWPRDCGLLTQTMRGSRALCNAVQFNSNDFRAPLVIAPLNSLNQRVPIQEICDQAFGSVARERSCTKEMDSRHEPNV